MHSTHRIVSSTATSVVALLLVAGAAFATSTFVGTRQGTMSPVAMDADLSEEPTEPIEPTETRPSLPGPPRPPGPRIPRERPRTPGPRHRRRLRSPAPHRVPVSGNPARRRPTMTAVPATLRSRRSRRVGTRTATTPARHRARTAGAGRAAARTAAAAVTPRGRASMAGATMEVATVTDADGPVATRDLRPAMDTRSITDDEPRRRTGAVRLAPAGEARNSQDGERSDGSNLDERAARRSQLR